MNKTISATELVRKLGNVLARVRYRREAFAIERNARPVARMTPVEGSAGTVSQALAAWLAHAGDDASFADDLERVSAADRPAANPQVSL